MTTVSMTMFSSRFDSTVDKTVEFSSFEAFADLLFELSKIPCRKPPKDKMSVSPEDAKLISPAIFVPGTSRKNVNVERWAGWAAIDVDSNTAGMTLEQIEASCKDYRTVIYSTGSSTPEKPKYRVVYALSHHVVKDKIQSFWHALNAEAAAIGDAQVKDLARMYYSPGQYMDAFNFFTQTFGEPINPEALMKKHPYWKANASKSILDRLPEDIQKKVLSHKASSLKKPTQTWTSYKDCPFVRPEMIAEYVSITGEGWYRKMYSLLVSIASRAVQRGYSLTPKELAELARSLDADTGNWYKKRDFEREAERALRWVYINKL